MATVIADDTVGNPLSDIDSSNYFGGDLDLVVEKYTNTFDADIGPGPVIGVDSAVYWTYTIENTGNVPLLLQYIIDDAGSPGVVNNDDDFHA